VVSNWWIRKWHGQSFTKSEKSYCLVAKTKRSKAVAPARVEPEDQDNFTTEQTSSVVRRTPDFGGQVARHINKIVNRTRATSAKGTEGTEFRGQKGEISRKDGIAAKRPAVVRQTPDYGGQAAKGSKKTES
jgi:hypothetical protein